jgi:predicted ArsR family transcriptional regulator
VASPLAPADELFAKVRELLGKMKTPRTVNEVTTDLGVLKNQAKEWLQRLVEDGVIEECTRKPVRYRPKIQHPLLE